MGPSALTLIRGAFLDRSEVALGCLVPNPLEPGQDFCPVKPPLITAEQIHTRVIENVHESLGVGKHAGLRTKLTRVFSATVRRDNKSLEQLVARRATLYYLKHPALHFEDLCGDDDTKEWIENVLKRCPIFLVTGFLTVTEAEVARTRQQLTAVQISAEVSVTDIASSGATAIFGNMPDSVAVGVSAGTQVNSVYAFVAPGERIIGVQYRKLTFKRFSAIDFDKARLKNNCWIMFLGDRRRKGININLGDILEANLMESLTADGLELEDEEGEKLNATLEDDEFVFVDE